VLEADSQQAPEDIIPEHTDNLYIQSGRVEVKSRVAIPVMAEWIRSMEAAFTDKTRQRAKIGSGRRAGFESLRFPSNS
jgi:hypothetical protein